MVAAGVADRLLILSPRVWKTEAVEHDPADAAHVREVVAHELVHVFHGQQNPIGDFEGMDDLGWFVEGLATYVSGQLSHEHRGAAAEAIQAGKGPVRLADAWSGRYRYGVCGSMVEFVDQRWGRETIANLLAVTKPEIALKLLGVTEAQFLEDWQKFVLESRK
jgi:Peptidase of plants and bacteria